MIRLIASDLDGTMLKDGAQILNPEYFDVIHQLVQKGICFVSASGRQFNNQEQLLAPIKDEISFISENGAHCVHEGRTYLERFFDPELAKRVTLTVRSYRDCAVAAACNGFTYLEEGDPKFIPIVDRALKTDLRVVKDLTQVSDPFYKMAVWCDSDNHTRCMEFREIFKEDCKDKLRIMTSGDHWLDFNTLGANKGTALIRLTDMLGIRPEECVAFGDQYNDVEMLQFAGESYVVNTSASGMEKYADHVTDSVLDSLREILDRL